MCKSCEQLRINGVVTHEIGCPDAWRDEVRECRWCGQSFKPEHSRQTTCSHSCDVVYNNLDCNCEECYKALEALSTAAEQQTYNGE